MSGRAGAERVSAPDERGTGRADVASYLLERAWVDGRVRDDVLVEVADGRFTSVTPASVDDRNSRLQADPSAVQRHFHRSAGETVRIPGLTLPGLANCHSHAFHRALRGRTQRGSGTFWTWRDQMYDVAQRLDPDRCFRLARATFREMALAGTTTVGEFHYLHHQPDGTPYADPNAMGQALVAAAREAGIRIALLDTCYLSSGFGEPVTPRQRRFSDGSAAAWAARVRQLAGPADPDVVHGAAIHSVRAVPADQLPTVVAAAEGRPLHVHVSEQRAENDDCRAAYGVTPTRLLHDAGALGPLTTAVHATHLTGEDVALLGNSGTTVCACPTTERDLGDGVGPSRGLHEAGARLSLGSDSHAVVDPFEEMRALELGERLVTQRRGHWGPGELLAAATRHDSLGFPDAGALAVGHRADLVTLDTTSPRTAGTGRDEATAVYAASASDVVRVMVGGRLVATADDREEVGRELAAAIEEVWS